MPYRSNRELPDAVKNVLPQRAQTIWRNVFNAQKDRDLSDERAFASAWAALENQGWEKDEATGKWKLMEKADHAWVDISKAPNGLWIGCQVPEDVAQRLVVRNGEPAESLHLTILYIPNTTILEPLVIGKVLGIVAMIAASAPSLSGSVSGVARFLASETSNGKDILVGLYDSPMLSGLRERLVQGLATVDIFPSQAHGYQPHISLAMLDPGQREPRNILIEAIPLHFDSLLIRWPDGEESYALKGVLTKREGESMPFIVKTAKQRYTLGIVYEPDTLDTDDEYASAPVIQRACWGFMGKLQGRTAATKRALHLVDAIVKALDTPEGIRLDVTELLEEVEKGRLGDQHSSWDDAYGEIVECYCAPCAMQIGDELVKAGTWLMGVIWHPDQFAKIEAGERTGYSMGGVGRKEYREALSHAA